MDLIVSWLLFPLLMLGLSVGVGLLVDRAAGGNMPAPLVAVSGFAAIIVVGQFLTLADATAEWTAPVVVALTVAGFGLGLRGLTGAVEGWAFAAGAAVLAVYAAPIALSGEPTIAGFIKLDDTATWLTLTDRIAEHGRDLGDLAPSSYEATLQFNLGDGYPVGVFVPLAVGSQLTGTDPAWLIQPYIAFGATLLALGLWSLARPLADRPGLRGATAFVAAQPALLFGYYLWGGVKEVVAAASIAGLAALAVAVLDRPRDWRALVAPALVTAGLLGVLSAGGVVWALPPLLAVVVLAGRRIGAGAAAARALGFAAAVLLLSLPLIVSDALLPPTSSPLTDDAARGNLIAPLDLAQIAGIWPAGDFRVSPEQELIAYLLVAVIGVAAAAGITWSLARGRLGPAVYVLGALAGCTVLLVLGSPWVDGKAMATASPAIPFAAMIAIGALARGGRAPAAGALAVVVVGGIAWSNALGYGGVSLAPHGQLADLEEIGELVAGQGPALMTEYEPYGVRHFLREADPEGISELRRRTIPLRDGSLVPKGGSADTDEIDPAALAVYRTLVLRRSPAQSRPPAPYELIWRGDYYEAWQRPPEEAVMPARLPLGDRFDPYGVPDCGEVRELARQGDLIAAAGEAPLVFPLSQPRGQTPKAVVVRANVPRSGTYDVWLGGSLPISAELLVDGEAVAEVRHELNNRGQYVRLGSAELTPGHHEVAVEFGGADLHPGSAGDPGALGPLVLSTTDASQVRLARVPAAEAESLCGKRWDWIEVAP